MKRLQAFKFELRPDDEQARSMRQFSGSCRFIYNKVLAIQIENYAAGNKYISYESMAKSLTGWRAESEMSWLKDAPYHCLQQAMKQLDRAYKNFFKGLAERPAFKRKFAGNGGFRFPDPKHIKLDQGNARIFVPKLGWMRYRKSRQIVGALRNVTITTSGGKWFASIQTQREVEQPVPRSSADTGIDVGIKRFATHSNGSHVDPIDSFKKHQRRLALYQRRMSRKVKFSSNWKKAKARVTRIHARIANVRRDFLHKTTSTISKNHALVCIEDLQVKNMSKSAKGNSAKPGKNVRQKSGLNRAILDQGWGEFGRQLEYKMAWNGGIFLKVPPQFTSQTCPCCAHISRDNRKTQAKFLCVDCGYENHADVVGAINILARGHRVLACGEGAACHSMKQEPTEAICEFSHDAVGIPVLSAQAAAMG